MRAGFCGASAGMVLGGLLGIAGFYATCVMLDFWVVAGYYSFGPGTTPAEQLPATWYYGYAFTCVMFGGGIGAVTGAVVGGLRPILRALKNIERNVALHSSAPGPPVQRPNL